MTSVIRYMAAALAAAGFALAQTATPAPTPTPEAAPPASGWAANQALRISTALNLSEEQKTQVQTILENRRSQLLPLLPQLERNKDAIQQLAEGGTMGEAFDNQLQTLTAAQASLLAQMATVRAKAVSQIWAVLTPAQRLKVPPVRPLLDPEGHPGQGVGVANPRYRRPMRPLQAQ